MGLDQNEISFLMENLGVAITVFVVILLGIIAIMRFGLQFDLNKYLESRKKKHASLAQRECPHMSINIEGDDVVVTSHFATTYGTTNWFCEKCGLVVAFPPEQDDVKKQATYFIEHPKVYAKRMREFQKHAKKAC